MQDWFHWRLDTIMQLLSKVFVGFKFKHNTNQIKLLHNAIQTKKLNK